VGGRETKKRGEERAVSNVGFKEERNLEGKRHNILGKYFALDDKLLGCS